ncbi:MAG: bacterial transcriptional activator domain-containing protein [Eggerthellaceae bacterium]|nr:bacterial transcriptional activator domain-containing protein [Eggerthellaceae bacterium]
MSGFIQKAACSGRRPSQFAGFAGFQRPRLIARLLNERSIARFVVAPTGYGKTSLLVDYAETMFAWAHVFWINGHSPCFIRDLDEGTIARDCLAADKAARLVVFDDVPLLDSQRASSFSEQIDELLAAQCEVVVSCTPRNDTLGSYQRDRTRITASELLLDDEELDSARNAEERVKAPASNVPDSGRVPMLVWGQERNAASDFVKAGLGEQMPGDLLLAVGGMLAMQKGQIDSLEAIGHLDWEMLEGLSDDYPHLGFDPDAGRFEAPLISVDDLAVGIKGALGDMVSASHFDFREQLVGAWADVLCDSENEQGRACDLVRVLCPRSKRARWLADRVKPLVAGGCFLEGLALAEVVRMAPKDGASDDRTTCLAFEAICRVMLGDVDGSVRHAKRLAFDDSVGIGPRICCLLILARNGNELLRERADAEILRETLFLEEHPLEEESPWVQLALSWRLLSEGALKLARWWDYLLERKAPAHVLCLTASWLFGVVAQGYTSQGGQPSSGLLCAANLAQDYVRETIDGSDEGSVDYFAASAGLAMERAHIKGMPLASGPLTTASQLLLRRWEIALLVQRARFGDERERSHAVVGFKSSRSSAFPHAGGVEGAKAVHNVPIMNLKMFGRFEISIGGEVIEDPAFRRKHVRLLLLLLSVHLGRDMSRAFIAKTLWPDADEGLARRNLYAIWSKLRHALTLSDGTCPYLVRHQFGCSLDSRYVHCDVVRLNEICRELLFGRPDFKGWTALYAEIDRDFSNELLPSENGGDIVEQIRNDCRSRLVDALVSATQSVIDGGNNQLAIWFARAAVGHDETREDAYVALMQAQIANSQRTSAMMTYHRCRRALADHLGMDPSPETTALYESLLDSL